jgi:hypothetical protein
LRTLLPSMLAKLLLQLAFARSSPCSLRSASKRSKPMTRMLTGASCRSAYAIRLRRLQLRCAAASAGRSVGMLCRVRRDSRAEFVLPSRQVEQRGDARQQFAAADARLTMKSETPATRPLAWLVVAGDHQHRHLPQARQLRRAHPVSRPSPSSIGSDSGADHQLDRVVENQRLPGRLAVASSRKP